MGAHLSIFFLWFVNEDQTLSSAHTRRWLWGCLSCSPGSTPEKTEAIKKKRIYVQQEVCTRLKYLFMGSMNTCIRVYTCSSASKQSSSAFDSANLDLFDASMRNTTASAGAQKSLHIRRAYIVVFIIIIVTCLC